MGNKPALILTQKEWEARKSVLSKIPRFQWPVGGYNLIYPDCPWSYNDSAGAGKRGAVYKYPTLSILELKMMAPEIQKISSENCALAMWATAPMMSEARELMDAWGFAYKTIAFTWIKTYALGERLGKAAKALNVPVEALIKALLNQDLTVVKPRKGMGNYTRSNAEFMLLGIKGKVERQNKGVGSVIISEIREHSRKPDEARDELVQLFGDIPRLEMFSRSPAKGWDSWGLEVGKFANLAQKEQ